MPKKFEKKERVFEDKTEDTEYALVTKKLGGGRFLLQLNITKKEVIGKLRGKFKKGSEKRSNTVDINSVVLASLRDYQANVMDIVHVYNDAEIRQLRKNKELFFEETTDSKQGVEFLPADEPFEFDEI